MKSGVLVMQNSSSALSRNFPTRQGDRRKLPRLMLLLSQIPSFLLSRLYARGELVKDRLGEQRRSIFRCEELPVVVHPPLNEEKPRRSQNLSFDGLMMMLVPMRLKRSMFADDLHSCAETRGFRGTTKPPTFGRTLQKTTGRRIPKTD